MELKHSNSSNPIPDSSSSFPNILTKDYISTKQTKQNVGMNAESLFMCTEGLGFESFDDAKYSKNEQDISDHQECFDTTTTTTKHKVSQILLPVKSKSSRTKGKEFPPPISSIRSSGKPCVSLKSYRSNGRFILKEVENPTQELLQACREDGRLKLQFVQSHDEGLYEDEDEELKNQTNEFRGESP